MTQRDPNCERRLRHHPGANRAADAREATARDSLVARLGAAGSAAGERIDLCLDAAKICLFDPESGESLVDPGG